MLWEKFLSYPDFLIIPAFAKKADKHRLFPKKVGITFDGIHSRHGCSCHVICAGIFYIYPVKLKLNAIEDEFAYNHIEVIMLIFIAGGINFLFFGLLSTIISNTTNIPIVGLLISLVYGLIWMSQYTIFGL